MPPPLKHHWSLANNYLAGITAGQWWRLLRENRFDVDAAYWHRAVFVSLVSLLNSWARRAEDRRYHHAIAATEVKAPLFILGHWRSGTTLLHNLLACDPQFAFANTYQVINPETFLTTEAINTRRFAWAVPERRLMDEMAMGFDLPQEDEFAPCLMTLYSLYLGISFPRRADDYERYLSFDGVAEHEIAEWKQAWLWFLKKLTLQSPRQLVLKSPAHTARIRLILDLFPDAKFIFIHRHPYDVFRSCRHQYDTAMWYTYLQKPQLERIDERIITRYNRVHDAFFRDRPMIPEGNYHEMTFAGLEEDPVGQIESAYRALGLDGFATFEPVLRKEVAALDGYRKNRFHELPQPDREKISRAWERSFREWNYQP